MGQFLAQFLAYLLTNNTNISFSFKTILINKCNGMEEGREVFQFPEQLALFQVQLLRLNGINNNLLKLPLSMEEGKEVFQFLEQPALSPDQLLRPNGINNNLLKLPLIMEERREAFQFQEQSQVLFQDLLVKPNGIKPNWLPLPQLENNLLLKNLNSHTTINNIKFVTENNNKSIKIS